MATSLQFGPEWMRKAPSKSASTSSIGAGGTNGSTSGANNTSSATNSANAGAGVGGPAQPGHHAASAPSTQSIVSQTSSGGGGGGSGGGGGGSGGASRSDSPARPGSTSAWPGGPKRNASLANLLPAPSQGVPAAVTSPPAASPGAFSFAAAASGGAGNGNQDGTGQTRSSSLSSSVERLALNGDDAASRTAGRDPAAIRYSKERLLSLYSIGGSLKSPNPGDSPAPSEAGGAQPAAAPAAAPSHGSKKKPFERDPTKRSGSGEAGAPLSPGIPSEPRGLNARGSSAEGGRPGLFARGSSSGAASLSAVVGATGGGGGAGGGAANAANAAAGPGSSSSRERFGGIQGGVLSGVGPTSRQRKSSENGTDTLRSSRLSRQTSEEAMLSPTPDAFNSVRSRSKASLEGSGGGGGGGEPATRQGESLSGRFRRERAPGEGPIGPNPDGSAGFGKFAGYSRRRERQASLAAAATTPRIGGEGAEVGGPPAQNPQTDEASADAPKSPDPSDAHGKGASAGAQDEEVPPPQQPHQEQQQPQQQQLHEPELELAQHASAVLGSLKLDEDEPPGSSAKEVNPATSAAAESEAPWSPDAQMWYYRDPSGQVQGPFSATSMQEWHRQSYFTPDLLVRPEQSQQFRPLADVILALGDPRNTFLHPPPAFAPPPTVPSAASGGVDPRSEEAERGSRLLASERPPPTASGFDVPDAPHMQPGGAADSTFDSMRSSRDGLGGSAFAAFGSNPQDAWPSAGTPSLSHRSWVPQLDLGFGQAHHHAGVPLSPFGGLPHSPFVAAAAAAPMSPFGGPAHFGGNLEARIRQQEEYLAVARQRELQERQEAARVAAAAAAVRERANVGIGQQPHFDEAAAAGGMGMPRQAWGPERGMSWTGGFSQQHQQGGAFGSIPSQLHPGQSQHDQLMQLQQQQQYQQQDHQEQHAQQQLQGQCLEPGHADHPETFHASPSPAPQDVRGAPASWQGADAFGQGQQPPVFADQGPAQAQQEHAHTSASQGASAVAQPPDAAPADEEAAHVRDSERKEEPSVDAEAEKVPSRVESVSEAAAPESAPASAKADVVGRKALEEPDKVWPQDPTSTEFASEATAASDTVAGSSAFQPAETGRARKSRKERKAEAAARADEQRAVATVASAAGQRSSPAASGNVGVLSEEDFKRRTEGSHDQRSSAASKPEAPLAAWLQDSSTAPAATTSPQASSKAAPWASTATRADESASANAPGISLREIQEAEAKKAEQKRAAERAAAQRARAAAAATSSVRGETGSQESLPTSMRWGLASLPPSSASKAGSGGGGGETGGATSSGAASSPWDAPARPGAAKTLTEIQEEERKRAQRARDAQSAQQLAQRRAYAESAQRQASGGVAGAAGGGASAAVAGGNGSAWTVVGAGGAKPTAASPVATAPRVASGLASATAAAAPAQARVVSAGAANAPWSSTTTAAVPRSANGVSTAASATVSRAKPAAAATTTSAAPAATVSAPVDPTQPSPEFLRYCKEQLKGLSVKADDFIEMLLSFPLDPSPDVVEIIAESVYANSSTLDGRRFAADFVAQRKLDAQARVAASRGGGGGGGGGAFGNGLPGGSAAGGTRRSASDVVRSGAHVGGAAASGGGLGGSAGGGGGSGGAGEAFGFKVVKSKGGKRRN